jgi:hypothetical protein
MFPAARKSGDAEALAIFMMALVIGAVLVAPLVVVLGAYFAWMLKPDGRPGLSPSAFSLTP